MTGLPKRVARLLRTLAWHVGGQKVQPTSGLKIPSAGHVAADAQIIYAEKIDLDWGVFVLSGAKLICSSMPPYVDAEGSIKIGECSIVREGAILQTYGGRIELGKHCTVNPYCVLQGNGGIRIGDSVLIGAHVCLFSANHVFADPTQPIRTQGETRRGIEIGDDVWIGAGAKILDGVRIARGAVVAAGAVVNS